MLKTDELRDFLLEKVARYNNSTFIESDPILVPHQYSRKEDIEIAAFISASLAWGKRSMIIKSAQRFMNLMDRSPYDFVMNHHENDLQTFSLFKHRTFNEIDAKCFIRALKHIYLNCGGLENAFRNSAKHGAESLSGFKHLFFEIPHDSRSEKHISDPMNNSAAKRQNMFLRWMVRKDKAGVDFGIWNQFSASELYCPLDVHSGRVARKLGLLQRKQDDWKATLELTEQLRKLDSTDPVKFDFALFGLGVFEKF